MLLTNKHIAIVGGGPGGLTLARLLHLNNHTNAFKIKVYERDLDKNARVQGAPLDLHDESGLAALHKAQLIDAFKANFLPGADRKKIVNDQAEVFYSDHDSKLEENFGDEHFRPEIARGTLRRILLESLPPEMVIWNSHFVSMEKQNEGWLLHFNNGDSAYADIVIAADGANSKIRPYITDIKPFYSGILMLEGNIYNAHNTAPQISILLNGGKIMAFGNEKDLLLGQKGDDEIGFYASFRAPENWATASGLDFNNNQQVAEWFKKNYHKWAPIWHELFEATAPPFIPRPIYCMPLDQTWTSLPNLTMIGDAAHVMPPFAGEGVNMAMLDALELSENLTSNQFSTLVDAISDFEEKMRNRAASAAKESLENGEVMHSATALESILTFFKG